MSDSTRIDFARTIIAKFGGVKQMSDDTGIAYGTIYSWEKTGVIPDKWRPDVLEHARRLGVDHTPWDYIAHLVDLKIAA